MPKPKNKEDFLGKKKQPHLKKDSAKSKAFWGSENQKIFAASERRKGRKKKGDSGEDESFKVEVDLGERETLEELAEQPETLETEASDFSEFVATSSEMPTLTLPSSPAAATNENLENSAASSIGTTATPTNQPIQREYLTVYNQPSYTGSVSEEKIAEGLRKSNRIVRTAEQLRDIQPRVEFEGWHEIEEARGRTRGGENLREYTVTELERREETGKKLPFEERRKYRELKR